VQHGFLYNGFSYTVLSDPLAGTGLFQGTIASGIDGNNVVGTYIDSSGATHGFLFNGVSYKTIDDPLAGTPAFQVQPGTVVNGISGNNIVGAYIDSSDATHGFLYNGSTYVTLDDPLAGFDSDYISVVSGTDGNNITGSYLGSDGRDHSFIATIPEPSSNALFGIGALGLAVVARRRLRKRSLMQSPDLWRIKTL
jgi:hypothetical protein